MPKTCNCWNAVRRGAGRSTLALHLSCPFRRSPSPRQLSTAPSRGAVEQGHNFFVAKLDLDGIWMINIFGGAANIAPKDYYAAKL